MRRIVLSDRRARVQTSAVRHVDLLLIGACLVTSLLGLLMIKSSTRALTKRLGVSSLYFVERQLVALMIAVVVMVIVMSIDYRKIRDHSVLFYLAAVAILVVVMSPLGSSANGAQSWINLSGGFQFQPSEFAKIALIIAIGGYLHVHSGELDAQRVITAVLLAVVPMGLIQLQPDFGTNMVLGVIFLALITASGVRARHLAVIALLAVAGAGLVAQLGVLEGYQVDRLTAFADPNSDTSGSAYNLNQSKTAIGNGGFFGRGYGKGTQTNLAFVPEQHTDFIFTAVGEELGFVGGATLFALFALIVWRAWRTAMAAGDLFGSTICVGVVAMFAFQIFENVGMTMGIMPVTGIPLPFMSYGGSALIAEFAGVGLVANVAMRRFV